MQIKNFGKALRQKQKKESAFAAMELLIGAVSQEKLAVCGAAV